MSVFQISRSAAESIVEAGTRNLYINHQHLPDYPRSHVLPPPSGHRVCTTSGWNGTSTGDNWAANVTIDGATVSVKCPLLRTGESIANGTTVIVSWNDEIGAWQVIEAQCPVET